MSGTDLLLKRFETPDEVRRFEKGIFEIIHVGGMTIGRATYEPGWVWSKHVGPGAGTQSCQVEHVGMTVSGRCGVRMDDGRELFLKPGDVFHVPPGHESWVEGNEPYVSIHFLGADTYTK